VRWLLEQGVSGYGNKERGGPASEKAYAALVWRGDEEVRMEGDLGR